MENKNKKIEKELSATPVLAEPESTEEMVNKYGTYEIQPTADTDNQYPAIAQGYNEKQKKHSGRE